jgi:hypothetical protein
MGDCKILTPEDWKQGSHQREYAFQIPVLMALAINYGEFSARRGGKGASELARLREDVYSCFGFTLEQKERKLASGSQAQLDQEVHRAAHMLDLTGEIEKIPHECWRITHKGLETLVTYTKGSFMTSVKGTQRLHEILISQDMEGQEFLVTTLRLTPAEHLGELVRCSFNAMELFYQCVDALSPESMGAFWVARWEDMRLLVGDERRKNFRTAFGHW